MVEAISHAYLLDMATDSILSAPYIAAERLAVEEEDTLNVIVSNDPVLLQYVSNLLLVRLNS